MAHFQFGEFVADESRFELRRSGCIVRVQRIVLETLFYLMRNRHRLVTKRDLEQGPWEGCCVSRAAVSRVIMLARRAIGDVSASVIVTVRGRGYRFVSAVASMADATVTDVGTAVAGLDVPSLTLRQDSLRCDLSLTNSGGERPGLESLAHAFDLASEGRGDMYVISGGSNARTGLLERFCHYLERRGAFVAWGRCWNANSAPPFWPWLEIVRSCVDSPGAVNKQPASLRNGFDLPGLLSHGGYLSDGLGAEDAEPALEDFKIFDAVTRFLTELAQAKPLVVFVENLQDADAPSLRLLEFLGQRLHRLPLLVVATHNVAVAAYRNSPMLEHEFKPPFPGMQRNATTVTV